MPTTTEAAARAQAWAQGYAAHAAGQNIATNPYLPQQAPPPPLEVTERLIPVNVKGTLTLDEAAAALDAVLATKPDVVALQEWGPARTRILKARGAVTIFPAMRRWNPLAKTRKTTTGYIWVKSAVTSRWIGLRADRYEVRFVKANVLVGPGKVDRIPGYHTWLGASVATVVIVRDLLAGVDEVLVNYHLTTHVEAGRKYRPEAPLRVARHKLEVGGLAGIAAYHHKRGRRVYMLGDGNYHNLVIPGLVSCWENAPAQLGGTHGTRRIDNVHGTEGPIVVEQIIATRSDHRHPITLATKRVPR